MENEYKMSEYYSNLANEVINEAPELEHLRDTCALIGYMESNTRKKSKGKPVFADCRKVDNIYKGFVPFDFLITVYEPNVELLNEQQVRILLEHELLHIQIENEDDINPIFSIRPHDVEDFRSIINKHGIDWDSYEEMD